MKKILNSNLWKAYKGRREWLNINKNYSIEVNDYIIILPDLRKEYNYLALLYLKTFLNNKKAGGAVIITCNKLIKKVANLFYDKIKVIEYNKKESIGNLLKFYCLYEFSDRIIIASLEEPQGRIGKNIIGKIDITLSEVFAAIVYNITDFTEVTKPSYHGADQEIKRFLDDSN